MENKPKISRQQLEDVARGARIVSGIVKVLQAEGWVRYGEDKVREIEANALAPFKKVYTRLKKPEKDRWVIIKDDYDDNPFFAFISVDSDGDLTYKTHDGDEDIWDADDVEWWAYALLPEGKDKQP